MAEKGGTKIIAIVTICVMLISIGFIGCVEDDGEKKEYHMTLEPEVRVTDKIYYQINISETFWTPPIWDEFNKEYNGKYSEGLRNEIIECMKNKSEKLGENPDIFEKCLFATGQFDEPIYPRIPCLAEKAQLEYYVNYKGSDSSLIKDLNESERGSKKIEPCWIFVIIWGVNDEDLAHIKIYAISVVELEILYFATCT